MQAHLRIRPEIADSIARLFDGEAEWFRLPDDSDDFNNTQALSDAFARFAASIRIGEPIYLDDDEQPYGSPMRREITSAVEHAISVQTTDDGCSAEVDWRYLSDLAALAAAIEVS